MNKVRASNGYITYRYKGPFGSILIGAIDDVDALNEAKRSLSSGEIPDKGLLERWNGEQWVFA